MFYSADGPLDDCPGASQRHRQLTEPQRNAAYAHAYLSAMLNDKLTLKSLGEGYYRLEVQDIPKRNLGTISDTLDVGASRFSVLTDYAKSAGNPERNPLVLYAPSPGEKGKVNFEGDASLIWKAVQVVASSLAFDKQAQKELEAHRATFEELIVKQDGVEKVFAGMATHKVIDSKPMSEARKQFLQAQSAQNASGPQTRTLRQFFGAMFTVHFR